MAGHDGAEEAARGLARLQECVAASPLPCPSPSPILVDDIEAPVLSPCSLLSLLPSLCGASLSPSSPLSRSSFRPPPPSSLLPRHRRITAGIAYLGDLSTHTSRQKFKGLTRLQLEMYQLEYNTVVWANRTIATTSNNERSGQS